MYGLANMTESTNEQDGRLLLTVDACSLRLAISRSATYRLIQTGALRSITIGRSRRIPVRALDEFISERLQEEFAE